MLSAKTKILVAEDVEISRKLLVGILASLNFKNIVQTDNGESAWEKLYLASMTVAPFELVICDWNMAGLSGLELLKKVRAHKKTCDLAFMMLTGNCEKELVLKAVAEHVTAYVRKPFDEMSIRSKLTEIADKIRTRPFGD